MMKDLFVAVFNLVPFNLSSQAEVKKAEEKPVCLTYFKKKVQR